MPEQGRFRTKSRRREGVKRGDRAVRALLAGGAAQASAWAGRDLPKTLTLTMVDVRETSVPADGEPLDWRLLTTHTVDDLTEARRIIALYRQRWLIEEFFHTLKQPALTSREPTSAIRRR